MVKKGHGLFCTRSCAGKARQDKNWQNPEYRQHMKDVHKGNIPTNLEDLIKASKESHGYRDKQLGKVAWNKGKKMPEIAGENNYRWIKDRTLVMEKHRLRGTLEWKNWRESVFKRDDYTCQECRQYSGYLEPNHIIPLRSSMKRIFDVNNGITLCRPCHVKTIWKEEQFFEKYSQLVANRV